MILFLLVLFFYSSVGFGITAFILCTKLSNQLGKIYGDNLLVMYLLWPYLLYDLNRKL